MSPSKDDLSSNTSATKPTIKGFSLSSKPTTRHASKPGASSKPSPPSSLGKRSRSAFASHHSDSESEDDRPVKHEAVTAFGAEGAIRENERQKEPLVIQRLGNRDWRGEARARMGGGKNLLPKEIQAQREAERREREGSGSGGGEAKVEGVDVVNSKDGEIVWGLTVRKKEDKSEAAMFGEEDKKADANGDIEDVNSQQIESKPKTADEEALEALLGNRKEKKGPDLVIPAVGGGDGGRLSEEDAYRRAIASAPEPSTLEEYERVPVEEFGAALLRGMGWKGPDKERKGTVKEIKRRQNLLGLGAKELKDAEELGAWVQKSDVKRLNGGGDRRPDRKPKASDYKREKERREERREERGGSYRRERERERDGGRDYRDRDRDRDRDRRR